MNPKLLAYQAMQDIEVFHDHMTTQQALGTLVWESFITWSRLNCERMTDKQRGILYAYLDELNECITHHGHPPMEWHTIFEYQLHRYHNQKGLP